jgi:RNA recognition motif-containing protein
LLGFCFVDFGSPADAEKALRLLNGRHLDSKHIFRKFLHYYGYFISLIFNKLKMC